MQHVKNMSNLPLPWITRIFKRFTEIYGEEAILKIDDLETKHSWACALAGIGAGQIQEGLKKCREEFKSLPSAQNFRKICEDYTASADHAVINELLTKDTTIDNICKTFDAKVTNITRLTNIAKSPKPVKKADKDTRSYRLWLTGLSDIQAAALSSAERYDRNRYLMEEEGAQRVRLGIASTPKKDKKYKDWRTD